MQEVLGLRAGVCHTKCHTADRFVPLKGRKVCKPCHASCASCHPKAHEHFCKSCPATTALLRNMDNATLAADVASGAIPGDGGRCLLLCPQNFAATMQLDRTFMCLTPPPTPSATASRSITPSGASDSAGADVSHLARVSLHYGEQCQTTVNDDAPSCRHCDSLDVPCGVQSNKEDAGQQV